MLIGENGILKNTRKAKIKTEVASIDEKLKLDKMTEDNKEFGEINDILNLNSSYNEKLFIENGKIVYDEEKVNQEEEKIFIDMGLGKKTKYYLVMNQEKKIQYTNKENIGTIDELSTLVNNGTFKYNKVYLTENISINNNEWEPIGTKENPFTVEFDGNNNSVTINIENHSKNSGIFGYNGGKISNIKLEGEMDVLSAGGIAIVNMQEGVIENCINAMKIIMNGGNSGGIAGINNGKINNCHNIGEIQSKGVTIGGIVGWNSNGEINNCGNKGTLNNSLTIGVANLGRYLRFKFGKWEDYKML